MLGNVFKTKQKKSQTKILWIHSDADRAQTEFIPTVYFERH